MSSIRSEIEERITKLKRTLKVRESNVRYHQAYITEAQKVLDKRRMLVQETQAELEEAERALKSLIPKPQPYEFWTNGYGDVYQCRHECTGNSFPQSSLPKEKKWIMKGLNNGYGAYGFHDNPEDTIPANVLSKGDWKRICGPETVLAFVKAKVEENHE